MKILVEKENFPPLFRFQLVSASGSSDDPAGLEGLTYHASELALRGAKGESRLEFDRRTDGIGAHLSFTVAREYVTLQGSCLTRHKEALLEAACDALSTPNFDADESSRLSRENRAQIDELRDDDYSLASRFSMHQSAPLRYRRSALGYPESLDAINIAECRKRFSEIWSVGELVCALAGDVSESDVEVVPALLQEAARKKPQSKALSEARVDAESKPKAQLLLIDKPDRHQCQVIAKLDAPVYGSRDYDLIKLAETALGGMFTARLMQEIRVKHGWSYGASSSLPAQKHPYQLTMSMAPSAQHLAPALKALVTLVNRWCKEGLGEEEFEFTRSYLSGSDTFTFATPDARVRARVRDNRYGVPDGFRRAFIHRLKDFDRSEVNSALQRVLSPESMHLTVVASADDSLGAVEDALGTELSHFDLVRADYADDPRMQNQ